MSLSEVRADQVTIRRYIALVRRWEAKPGTTRRDGEGRHIVVSYNDRRAMK